VIQTLHEDQLTQQEFKNDQLAILPGLGVYYALTDELGVLAGAHRGFSPVPPQAVSQGVDPEEIEPETSLNYEGGVRWSRDRGASHAELIGFFNDYNNLTGICSFSSGCAADQLDRQFNAGEVQVYGLEVSASHALSLGELQVPVRLAYTLTRSSFPRAFVSEDPLYGEVEEGDALPYVPEHQGSLLLGVQQGSRWGVHASATYTSALLEQAGRFDAADAQLTEAQFYLDAKGDVTLWDWLNLYLKVDNALDSRPIAARRPFGARPARPFQAQAGLQATF
jgi:Fe(3+) dicitrate transport protein